MTPPHISQKELEKIVSEHFTFFLLKNGMLSNDYQMNKRQLKDVFVKDYLPKYHSRLKPQCLFQALAKENLINKNKNNENGVVKFIKEKVERISSKYAGEIYGTSAGNMPPANVSVSQPIVKVYVSQDRAFRTPFKKSDAASNTDCKLCSVKFKGVIEYEAHLSHDSHKVKETYRINRRALQGKNDVIITSRLDDESGEIIVREGASGIVPIVVSNTGKNGCQLLKLFVLCELKEIKLDAPFFPTYLDSGDNIKLSLEYEFCDPGVFIYPLVLKVSSNSERSPFVLKDMIFRVQSEILDDLKPSTPYRRASKPMFRHHDAPIIYGDPLPPVASSMISVVRLPQYELPANLRRVINHGFKPFDKMTSKDEQKLKEVRALLNLESKVNTSQLLNEKNYSQLFKLLLHIEEHQMENDIHIYDSDNQELNVVKEDKKFLSLKVPGLSENRPSILPRDSVFVMVGNVKYEGVVHSIRESEVWLSFHESFRNKFVPNMRFHVEYQFNRWPLRCVHRAVEMIKNHGISPLLFPKQHNAQPPKDVKLKPWFNKAKLSTNVQQQQAVRNIVLGTSYPSPYLVFGPPGTGKTVTLVEAITQLYHINTKNHLLVCTPSNSSANEITRRLISSGQGQIPDSAVFRFFAATYNSSNIPEELKKVSNYKDEYYYPSVEELKQKPIIVVTLVTAARLVTAAVPPGHFSYLFIDESGQAIEPEVLVPIAGLFTKEKGDLLGQLVLAGDPKQLGPVLRSQVAIRFGLNMSLLERLMDHCDLYKKSENSMQYNPAVLTKLVQNYRSHKQILALSNILFYDNELQACGDPVFTSLACNWDGLPKKGFPLIFHAVHGKDQREGRSPSYFNLQEIDIIIHYVKRLLEDRLCGRKLEQKDIGVITPYRRQVEKIKTVFKKKNWDRITVGSVEEFQGQERLVIIISTVRSTMELLEEDYKFHVGFLKNPKRFNVALTRSKALLITVGDPNVLQSDVHWRHLVHFCRDNGGYKGPFKYIPLPKQADELADDLSALTVTSPGANKTADTPCWRGDV